MKLPIISLLALFNLLQATNASSDPVADKRCAEINGAGWEARLDGSTGKPTGCQIISRQDNCYPEWMNPHTGKYECCPVGTTYASDEATGVSACCGTGQSLSTDPTSKTGACCNIGLHWTFDRTSSKGSCCPQNQNYNGINCLPKPVASSVSSSVSKPVASSVQPTTPTPTIKSAPGGSGTGPSTSDAAFCSVYCPSKSVVSTPSTSVVSTPSTPSPSIAGGGIPAGQAPLKESPGSSCQLRTTQINWFNGTCRGLQLRSWQYPDLNNQPDIEVGTKVNLRVIGSDLGTTDRPADLSTFRFPVDTWLTIANYGVREQQGRCRVYADDKLVGIMSPLPSDQSNVCWNGGADPCMIAENTGHSRGVFFIPAGTSNISLEHFEGYRMHYYAVRHDAVCSELTPCQGQQLQDYVWFQTPQVDPIFPISGDYSITVEYADDVLLTLVDAGFAASQWTLSIDGTSQGALNRPVYLTQDHFMNTAVRSDTDPGHCFAWGAYWRVYVIPKGKHTVTMRVTGGLRTRNDGRLYDHYEAMYKINKPCCAPQW